MGTYEVKVDTAGGIFPKTTNYIYMRLVGEEGESDSTWISEKCEIKTDKSLGKLQQIVIHKETSFYMFSDDWLPEKIEVKTHKNETYIFPLYTWITDGGKHYFREGQAFIPSEDPFDPSSRQEEISKRQDAYRWKTSEKGIPDHIKAKDTDDLPKDAQFTFSKATDFKIEAIKGMVWDKVKSFFFGDNKWSGFDEIGAMMDYSKYKLLDYVRNNWKDDDFFGYQFLNGLNPMVIRRCDTLPDNFPVTDDMISQYSKGPSSLDQEMKCGNIFLCDYEILDGVETRKIHGKQQYLTAPLVLLYKTTDDKLVPIAIQLKQEPGADNPIFLPTDHHYEWLLAKTFVRSAEFNLHQLNFHLLRTHLLAEVFAVSTRRNLPMVHPLYKLLIPHTRYTLAINVLARQMLISEHGVFTEIAASGGEGMFQLLRRSLSKIKYRSLCIPDDIEDRGMDKIPNFYYRDDGMKLWNSLHRFVSGILKHYYKTDKDVKADAELQDWIGDIFKHGFLSNKKSGIPNKFTTVADLVKFVTMVIFTGSVQHSAVNSGQFDFGGWMPNLPSSMGCPPPTKKGKASEATLMEALPNKSVTRRTVETLYLLTQTYSDFVAFGDYPEEHFTEKEPRRRIEAFQKELKQLSDEIKKRNKKLDFPYEYLDPEKIGNSVTI
ncbi:polyunsaturated fatty acid lipoxygenase ALOX15B-like [Cyprinodon tularosa]|uniref:polyunsaturated fatty acid lipoxygenase ALOX15B-like n=1 Tax=Cyprinodon tularosa TaxID=77115 RepID=UPI0018E20D8B|nr:polyunsaturated fatty acid lipoxygenase ALOX15B-like [Cyprinodon tularosa]